MRLLLAALVPCCALIAVTADIARGERTFPYKARITTDDVYVRSGPGQTYYPTDKLEAGQEVEVYRHDPGGWYAIRPPQGSFTWVSARFLRPGVDNLAVVTDDRVAARVGSAFSDIRDVIQVRLHKAEVVEVLDRKRSEADSGETMWYKIAPPSGEFRWVFGKYVDADYKHDGVRKTSAVEIVMDPPATTPAETTTPPDHPPAQDVPTDESPSVTVRPPADTVELNFGQQVAREISPEQYRAELERIDVELSVMVVEEPTVWSFTEMRPRVEELLDQAETAVERGLARAILSKIDRFEDLRRRYDKVNLARKQSERSSRRLSSLNRRELDEQPEPVPDDRYDGVGELTRVVSQKLGAPRYALVDRTGGVSCYVSPAPGVNLRHYVGQRVGVNGTRGYMPEQRAPHVMAQHIAALDGRRFR